MSKGSEIYFIVNNVFLDIPNSPQTCLPVSEMESLTNETIIIPDTHYYATMDLGVENNISNGLSYFSEFCLTQSEKGYKIVAGDIGSVTPNYNKVSNYCTDNELQEQKSWLQRLKEWLLSLFKDK